MSVKTNYVPTSSSARHKADTGDQPQRFANQDYEMIRERHLQRNLLFTDKTFPPNMNSIGSRLEHEFNNHKIEWKRPTDICKDPHFIVDGTTLFDILQSKIGNCWVLSAIASITLKPGLLEKIMPGNQGYSRNYAGIFHFRLWHLGELMDIVVDDYLPFLDGKFFSVRPSCSNEFWPCLLEKAYAKFLGSYQNLHWGDPSDAFLNLTGGLTMTFDLGTSMADTWNMIRSASPETLMACIRCKKDPPNKTQNIKQRSHVGDQRRDRLNNDVRNDNAPEQRYPNVSDHGQGIYAGSRRTSMLNDKLPENILRGSGLVDRHAYSVTDYTEVPFQNGFVRLVRIWNPWGYGEWNGRWSDRCPLWNELRLEDRLKLQEIEDDGQFWMCWEDFTKEFSHIIICSQVPEFNDFGDKHKKWSKKTFRDRWTKDKFSWNNIDKDFLMKNSVCTIKVSGSDQVQIGVNVVVSLMQNSRNQQRFGDWLPIGFVLVPLSGSKNQLSLTPEIMSNMKCYQKHQITESLRLTAGTYAAIPYTTQRKHESSFYFQVFQKSEDCTK